jgi:hypothetical protein
MEETRLIKAKTVSQEDSFNIVEYATKKKAKDGREYFDRSNFYLLGENPKFSTKVDHYRSIIRRI